LIKLSPQQDEAFKVYKSWLTDKKDQIFYLAGFAGTGKTTLSRVFAGEVKGDVAYCAYTGKAASVMRKKGCDGASTIHSLIYHAEEDEKTGLFTYTLNTFGPVHDAKLVIMDECSMVDGDLAKDLLSYGTKILVLGDPFQLPPVNGAGFFTAREPNFVLTEIHRQAAENPIIRMSMDLRSERRLKPGCYGRNRVVEPDRITKDELRDYILKADQVIVGRNKTRASYNRRIRGLRHNPQDAYPVPGEKLICLRNNHGKGLLNGTMWEPLSVGASNNGLFDMEIKSFDDPNRKACERVTTDLRFFLDKEKEIDTLSRRYMQEFTYGHAITCHKSQGSQWDKTVVFDEGICFRLDAWRWRYTALTRAAEEVVYVT
jgi:exodeoxyribonuclease-5